MVAYSVIETNRTSSYTKGVLWMIVSTILFVSVDAVIKHVGQNIHPFEMGFFRNVFGFLFLLPALVRTRFSLMRSSRLGLHFLRGLLGVGATLTFFYALTVVPLVEVISISFAIPIFAVFLAVIFLKERPSALQWTFIFMGFLGAMIIIRPGFIPISIGTVLLLISALLNACILIIVKRLSTTESSLTISAWMCIFVGMMSLPFAIPHWTWPTFNEYCLLALIGILATSAQYAVAEALRHADASTLMPAEFLKLIWAAIIGYIFFSEVADLLVYLGAIVVISANIFSTLEIKFFKRA